jgi:hypothetical protein
MKHVKIYEEFYSEGDLKSLINDLSGVGLSDKFEVECNVFIMVPNKGDHPYEWPEWAFRNIEVEVSCLDDRKIILEKAFEKVLKGEFTQESNTYLDQMFKSTPELVHVLSKENMIQLAKKANQMVQQHEDGKLHTLQAKLLVPEIEDLMYSRLGDIQDLDFLDANKYAIKHLDENIGYNIRITKL